MLRTILVFAVLTSTAFAHTECYLNHEFKDKTYGFILQDRQVDLILPFNRFVELQKKGSDLFFKGEVVGHIDLENFPHGTMQIDDESREFKCTVWPTGGRG